MKQVIGNPHFKKIELSGKRQLGKQLLYTGLTTRSSRTIENLDWLQVCVKVWEVIEGARKCGRVTSQTLRDREEQVYREFCIIQIRILHQPKELKSCSLTPDLEHFSQKKNGQRFKQCFRNAVRCRTATTKSVRFSDVDVRFSC